MSIAARSYNKVISIYQTCKNQFRNVIVRNTTISNKTSEVSSKDHVKLINSSAYLSSTVHITSLHFCVMPSVFCKAEVLIMWI